MPYLRWFVDGDTDGWYKKVATNNLLIVSVLFVLEWEPKAGGHG